MRVSITWLLTLTNILVLGGVTESLIVVSFFILSLIIQVLNYIKKKNKQTIKEKHELVQLRVFFSYILIVQKTNRLLGQ